jgi:hypothetical protein
MSSVSLSVYLASVKIFVLIVMSTIKALTGGCHTPTLIHGPLLISSTDFTIKFMADEKQDE